MYSILKRKKSKNWLIQPKKVKRNSNENQVEIKQSYSSRTKKKVSLFVGKNIYHIQYYFIQKIQIKMSSQCCTMIQTKTTYQIAWIMKLALFKEKKKKNLRYRYILILSECISKKFDSECKYIYSTFQVF